MPVVTEKAWYARRTSEHVDSTVVSPGYAQYMYRRLGNVPVSYLSYFLICFVLNMPAVTT